MNNSNRQREEDEDLAEVDEHVENLNGDGLEKEDGPNNEVRKLTHIPLPTPIMQ